MHFALKHIDKAQSISSDWIEREIERHRKREYFACHEKNPIVSHVYCIGQLASFKETI